MRIDIGVLTVVAAVLVALSVRAGVRLVRGAPSTASAGVVALVVWTLLGAVAAGFETEHQITQSLATAQTRFVSGRSDAVAVCTRRTPDLLDLSGTAGMVRWDTPHVARLRADTCWRLATWIFSDKRGATEEQLVAVHVLVHEAVHVAGVHSEAVTECVAMGLDRSVAENLGASATVAAQMARTYREQVYPRMPTDYRGDCGSVGG
jgi:hypothetical protein